MTFREELHRLTEGKDIPEWVLRARAHVCHACDWRKPGEPPTCRLSGKEINLYREDCERWRDWRKPQAGLMPWEAVWQIHLGKTFLVIGRGPSAQCADTDLDAIPRDIAIATNLALWTPEKQRETNIDYNISVDEKPNFESMPEGVKIVSAANTDKGIAQRRARNDLFWCVSQHQGFDWKYLRYGRPLPTSFNSGIAAVSLACYMGARHIKIIGIEYNKVPEAGGMHTNDPTPEKRSQTEKDFDRTFGRAQKGAHALARWCAVHGVALETLARESRLQWTAA